MRQARCEIDLAAHRALGDGSDLRLDTEHVGDLVHAFDADQRRVHIHGDEPDTSQALRRGHETTIKAACRAELRYAVLVQSMH